MRRGRSVRLERKLPVVLATFVFTLLWTIAILNPDVTYPAGTGRDDVVLSLLEPHASPVVFAFLGSYVFTLLSLLRSYVRSDLRPKSYTHAVVRVVVAVVSAWVLQVIVLDTASASPATGNGGLLVAAFVIGFFPETLFVRLQEVARSLAPSGRFRFYERAPLTELTGIDIYDRSRLMDEGVGNIEGLAHHNLPELMLQTRIPVGRLVHWVDQAILYLHVVTPFEGSTRDGASPGAADPTGEHRLHLLQGHGIHTATDLLRVVQRTRADRDRVLALLDEPDSGPRRGRPHRLELIATAIRDEQWIKHLEHWYDPCHARTRTIRVSPDGEIEDPRAPCREPRRPVPGANGNGAVAVAGISGI
jgi:hypothetical protein